MALLLLAAPQASEAQNLYVLSNNNLGLDGATTDFGTVNLTTGAYTSIASLSGAYGNLTWNAAANKFWVTKGNLGSSELTTLSTTGTVGSSIGTIGKSIYGMAYRSSQNRLYAFDSDNNDTGYIDPATGGWTSINASPGVTVTSPAGGRYSILNDTLYMTAHDGTGGSYTVDYTTGAVNKTWTSADFRFSIFANNGTTNYGIFGNQLAGAQQLFTWDPTTNTGGGLPSISGSGLGTVFHGAAFGQASGTTGGGGAVPEPGEWAAMGILGAGLTGLVIRKRRRA